ncbi:MAG: DUF1800 domain-containing protein [Ignavibacteria bacterium]|nr:DUF1800 domain-containing protein [Ignavibacteria bacterium]
MNRRNFFTLGVPLAETDALSQESSPRNQAQPAFATRTTAGLEPYVPSASNPWDYSKAAHLLRRCMFGPKDTEIRKAVTDGLDATITQLLTPFTPSLTEISSWAGQDPNVRPPNNNNQSTEFQAWQTAKFNHRDQLIKWWVKTIATSPVSIQERLIFMWHNHFANEINVVDFAEFMLTQNLLFRKYIFGDFKQMVKEITKDPSMLIYLDGTKNYKSGNRSQINENYSRELQELFTCGVTDWNNNPNYTEMDVAEGARALSGWVINPSPKGAYYLGLTSAFTQGRWDAGNKTFMGKTGAWKADDIVDIIFAERADQTAKFVCTKIYRTLVYDIPDPAVVTAMADTFKANNWSLKPVIDQLIRSAHFFDATNIGAMEKSPIDYLVGAVRMLGLTDIPDFDVAKTGRMSADLSQRLSTIGQIPLGPPNVKGWPGGRTWVSTSTLPIRQKFMLDVMDSKIMLQNTKYYKFDAIAFAKSFPSPNDATKLAQEISNALLNVPPSQKEADALLEALLQGAKTYEWNIDDPTFQADKHIRNLLKAIVQLAKHELY